jgi:hypothetical protein
VQAAFRASQRCQFWCQFLSRLDAFSCDIMQWTFS